MGEVLISYSSSPSHQDISCAYLGQLAKKFLEWGGMSYLPGFQIAILFNVFTTESNLAFCSVF